MSYRWLEHTSELALQIDAPSEQAVFEQALLALGELTSCEDEDGAADRLDSDRARCTREFTVAAEDRATLLAAFLEELVYLAETDDFVAERLERLKLAGGQLMATVRGRRGSPRHMVKGVTYHELAFAPSREGFTATVVLDV